jgi:phage terminase large subunit GpA-like protein
VAFRPPPPPMDPGPIILLMPTDDDARGISVDWVEPLFRSNKTLRGLMRFGRLDGRNTLTRKSLAGGGSLKILSARAPRNLSRHDCRLLLCDEVDRYEVTTEVMRSILRSAARWRSLTVRS